MKRASEIFAKVDPKLKVIDGGTHYRRKRPYRITNADWFNAEGLVCFSCGQEAMRVTDGLCLKCQRKIEAERMGEVEDKSMKRYYQAKLREGTISLAQMREGGL